MTNFYFIINIIQIIGKKTVFLIIHIGKSGILLINIVTSNMNLKKNSRNFIKQFYIMGFLSLGIIIISSLFIGMVVGLQGYYILQKFGTEEVIGQMISLTIIRELGPVMSALLFVGRTGASLAAEICLMKNTDQMLAIENMGIDPIGKIITPKFWAGLISMIILAIIFIVMAIIGSYIATVLWLKCDNNIFWSSITDNIDFKIDIINSIIKSSIFGFVIIWVALFQGINSKTTIEGIIISTTNTVVYSTFIILIINFFLTSLMFNWI